MRRLIGLTMVFAACSGGEAPTEQEQPRLARVTLTPDSVSIERGGAATLQATAFDQFGAPFAASSWGWSTTRIDVAAVSVGTVTPGAAVVTGMNVGTSLVSVTVGSVADTTKVVVVPAPPPLPPPANVGPTATIHAPVAGRVDPRTPIVFRGTVIDPEDGKLEGVWSSNVDGQLGRGDSIRVDSLSMGDHVVTLQGTDSKGVAGARTVALSVRPPGQDITGPQLISLSINPNPLDLTAGQTQVTFQMVVTEENSGVRQVGLILSSTTSSQSHVINFGLTSGTRWNGTWRATQTFASTAARGQWTLQIGLFDLAGNLTSYLPGQYPAELTIR